MYNFPREWKTDRLTVRHSQLAEADRLRDIFNACSYVGEQGWDPTFVTIDTAEMIGHIENGLASDLSQTRQFHIFSVFETASSHLIGYFHLTLGLPEPHLVWLSMLVIDPNFQGNQYAQELITSLFAHPFASLRTGSTTSPPLTHIRIEVYLKNWPALRFWLQQGFTTILELGGDKNHTPTTHASLILERTIQRR